MTYSASPFQNFSVKFLRVWRELFLTNSTSTIAIAWVSKSIAMPIKLHRVRSLFVNDQDDGVSKGVDSPRSLQVGDKAAGSFDRRKIGHESASRRTRDRGDKAAGSFDSTKIIRRDSISTKTTAGAADADNADGESRAIARENGFFESLIILDAYKTSSYSS